MVKRLIAKITLQRIATYTVAFVLGVAAFGAINWILTPDPWSPLGPYPVQTIVSEKEFASKIDDNAVIPLIPLSQGYVESVGIKCSSEEVTVNGYYGWQSLIPGGFSYRYPQTSGSRRIDGCQTFNFRNEIPPEVLEWAEDAIDSGQTPEILLSGCETPKRENGETGVEVCWRTEPFAFEK